MLDVIAVSRHIIIDFPFASSVRCSFRGRFVAFRLEAAGAEESSGVNVLNCAAPTFTI
ncbi:hypothetical protein B932_3732 (plasmid) [Gluconobacter oxydans H24]|nr:hypothetical protein B932_3732 [Gluconobacter oxydans H24]